MPHIKTFSRYVPAVSAAAVDADPSIGEMKRALQSAMVNIASCVEKSDLRAKYDALTPYQKKRGGGGGVAGAKFAYVIVCSHNLSGAAWGKLEHGGSQIHVYSYELGVMFLPSLIGARTAKPFSALSATEADPFRCLAAVRPRATTTATATATSEGAVVLTHALTLARPPGARASARA